ncbi:PREDICTED: tumor necrosis factor ligand superfamily member 15 [Gavialis gangeticus]|uniref:tumor necrosis factor ligand superfamily member 15 n=1 Tax=Gavialis gangeticus TaxID=94835 RepID=UPI00092E80AA|nr:PREDICTED: tumor necrosis factor ligand superfamily member 15 [Gavialis gangeticus]
MERLTELTLEEAAARANQDAWMHIKEDFRKMRWTVIFCMLSVLVLTLPTAYLLVGNFRAHKPSLDQVAEERAPNALKQQAATTYTVFTDEKPRAHLTVKKQDSQSAERNQFPVLQWEDNRGLAFTKNNLHYTNKSLVIPEAGDYFIYAQVTFRGPIPDPSNTASVTQIITKVTDSYPEPTQLLTGTKTLCENTENQWVQHIYLGAVLQMLEGDRLMVNVSDIRLVDYTKEHKTFFGAFLL